MIEELYVITTPVGDRAEADTYGAARTAAVTLLADSEEQVATVKQFLGERLATEFRVTADGTVKLNQGQLRGCRT